MSRLVPLSLLENWVCEGEVSAVEEDRQAGGIILVQGQLHQVHRYVGRHESCVASGL